MIYQYILMLPVTVVLFWFVKFFFQKKEQLKSQWIFIAFLLMVLVNDVVSAYIVSGAPYSRVVYDLDYLDTFAIPLIPPLMFLHLRRMVVSPRLSWKSMLLFVPAIIVGVGNLILGVMMGYEGHVAFTQGPAHDYALDFWNFNFVQWRWFFDITLYDLVMIVQLIVLFILAVRYLFHYRSRLKNFYAIIEDKSLGNLQWMLIWMVAWIAVAAVQLLARRMFFTEHPWLAVVYSVVFSVTQGAVCYYNYHIEFSTQDLEVDEIVESIEEPETEVTEIGGQNDYLQIEQKLTAWLSRDDKPYLAEKLTIAAVVKETELKRNQISEYLNGVLHLNFNAWINRYRMEEAKRLLLLPENFTMLDIASRCGLTDSASFTRLFKKHVGVTPSEYRSNPQTAA